jgi:hypothetical protein
MAGCALDALTVTEPDPESGLRDLRRPGGLPLAGFGRTG